MSDSIEIDTLLPLKPPDSKDFGFPFTPYDIQEKFMKTLYNSIEEKRVVAIFESPTGTGKSLSLLCGAIKWLKDNEERMEKVVKEATNGNIKLSSSTETLVDPNEPDWVQEHAKKQQVNQQLSHLQDEIDRNKKKREKLAKLREKEMLKSIDMPTKRQRHAEPLEDDFCVDEYFSEEEMTESKKELQRVKKKGHFSVDSDSSDDEVDKTKIFYSSRTHSQLAQVIGEVKKTGFGKDLMTVSLGSRKNLCINPQVNSLKSLARINDKCLDLGKKKEQGCPFHGQNLGQFRDAALAKVQDIEDLVQLGKRTKICPYYGTRHAIKSAELVTLPYNLLLQKSARDSLGISLKNHVVIIDEAHNLIDTISQIHSVQVDVNMIARAQGQLERYYSKYKERLSGKNVEYIQEILFLLRAMVSHLKSLEKNSTKMYQTQDFVETLHIEDINLFKLDRYMQESRIAQKLHGFVEKVVETLGETDDFVAKHVSALSQTHDFLMCLAQANRDGRVIVANSDVPYLKYLLLNPSHAFQQVVQDARCVIVAGGTMEPIGDFQQQLFPTVPVDKIVKYQCGHVIPPSSLSTFCVSTGPTGMEMDFTFEKRNNPSLMDETGLIVSNLINHVPAGMVVFFPSYAYMDQVVKRWKSTGIYAKIEKKKEVFMEPRDANQLEQTLRLYGDAIRNKSGALLISVVGGKMSEGINFSDDLGRCVVMIGLPFANIASPELREKMSYLNQLQSNGGQEYYENLCLRAVNQSIGRAIRHRQDYSTIVLLDKRYSQDRIKRKIPAWIRQGMVDCPNFGKLVAGMAGFFKRMRNGV